MGDRGKQQPPFDFELNLRIRRRRAVLPWLAVAGLALIYLPRFWGAFEKFLFSAG